MGSTIADMKVARVARQSSSDHVWVVRDVRGRCPCATKMVSHDAQNLVVALRRAAASDRYRSQPRAEEHRRQSSDADLHGPSRPIRLVRSRLADQRPEWPIRSVRSRLARPEFTVPAELDLPSASGEDGIQSLLSLVCAVDARCSRARPSRHCEAPVGLPVGLRRSRHGPKPCAKRAHF